MVCLCGSVGARRATGGAEQWESQLGIGQRRLAAAGESFEDSMGVVVSSSQNKHIVHATGAECCIAPRC